MLINIAFLMLLCSGGVWMAVQTKHTFEEALPFTAMSMVFIVFVFGVCGSLIAGVIACVILALLLYGLSLYSLIRNQNWKDAGKRLFTPGFAVFSLLFLVISICNIGKLASQWDEFSHWVDIVKVMTTLDDFGTNGASASAFQSYPPGMSVFQYILQKLTVWLQPGAVFSEWRVYVAYQLFALIPLMPFFKTCSFRKPLHLLICIFALFVTPLMFYSDLYRSVYIDPYLGIVSGAGLLLIFLWKEKDWLYHSLIWCYCGMLILAKDAGMMFAIFLLGAYVLDLFVGREGKLIKADVKKNIVLSVGALLSILIPKLLWNLELHTSHAKINFSEKFDFGAMLRIFLGKDTSYRTTVLKNYAGALFSNSFPIGHTQFQFSYFVLLILCLLSLFLLIRWTMKTESSKKRTAITVMSVTAAQLLFYLFGLCATYMFKFSAYEALKLASMSRYLNMVYLAAWLVIIGVTCYGLGHWVSSVSLQACTLSAMLIATPVLSAAKFITGSDAKASQGVRAAYVSLDQQVKKHCDGDDRIYFIAQDTNGFDYWVSRFNARPNGFNPNFTWGIGESSYADGIYTVAKSPEQWQQELLSGYDYVAIYKLNDYFIQNYASLFEDPAAIAEQTLYQVVPETGLLRRCQ